MERRVLRRAALVTALALVGCGPGVMSLHANGSGGGPSAPGPQYFTCESVDDTSHMQVCTGPVVGAETTADGPHAYLPAGCSSIQHIVIEDLNCDHPRVRVWCVAPTLP